MGVTEDLEAWFSQQYSSTVSELRQWYDNTTHHGSFCGAGTRGTEAVDDLDSCCRQHDADYSSVSASADDMWSPDALARTREADQALVSCAGSATTTDPDYKDNLIWLFSTRVWLADMVLAQRAVFEAASGAVDGLKDWVRSVLSDASEPSDETRAGFAQWASYLEQQGVSRDDMEAAVRDAGGDPASFA